MGDVTSFKAKFRKKEQNTVFPYYLDWYRMWVTQNPSNCKYYHFGVFLA